MFERIGGPGKLSLKSHTESERLTMIRGFIRLSHKCFFFFFVSLSL